MAKRKPPNSVDIHVGRRLRMRRLLLGTSQETLGAALGVSFQQVQKYEKGSNRIGASRLQQIAGALEVPVSFFFEGAPNSEKISDVDANGAPSPAYLFNFLASPDGLALTRAYTRIKDKRVRRKIVALVHQISGGER